jgi:Cofactor assembly of complex C subunit B
MPHNTRMHLSLAGQVTQAVTFQAGTRRARQLFAYMKNYNYTVKSTGEVITFAGNYRSRRGQAAAITFYMLMGMLSCGLVLSIAAPGGALWYYYRNADRCALQSQGVLC